MRSLTAWLLLAFACGVCVLQASRAIAAAGRSRSPPPRAWRSSRASRATRVGRGGRRRCALGLRLCRAGAPRRLADALPREWEGEDIRVGRRRRRPARHASDSGVRFAFAVEERRPRRGRACRRASRSPGSRTRDDDDDVVPSSTPASAGSSRVRLQAPARQRQSRRLRPRSVAAAAEPARDRVRAWRTRATRASTRSPAAFATTCSAPAKRCATRILRALDGEPYAGVIVALAIGDQRAIPEAQWTVFNRTGIAHLVSISGSARHGVRGVRGRRSRSCSRGAACGSRRAFPARKVAAAVGRACAAGATRCSPARRFRRCARSRCSPSPHAACGSAGPGTAGDRVAVGAGGRARVGSVGAADAGILALVRRGRAAALRVRGDGCASPQAMSWRQRAVHAVRESAHAQWVVTVGLAPLTLALFAQTSLIAPLANAVAIPVVTLVVVPLALTGIFGAVRRASSSSRTPRWRRSCAFSSARGAAGRHVAAARAAARGPWSRDARRRCGCSRRAAVPGRALGFAVARAAVRRAAARRCRRARFA